MLKRLPTILTTILFIGCMAAAPQASLAQSDVKIPEVKAIPALTSMLPEKIRASGVLHIATDAHYPPCQWFLEDGKTMVGYEVDIWDALSQALGVKNEVVSVDFGALIPGVSGGRYDMAIECITDRVEREEQVTFVNHSLTYGNSFYYLMSNKAIKQNDASSLCGLHTAGQTGTDFLTNLSTLSDWCVKKGLKALTIEEFPQQSAVLLALFSGRIDFALSEASAVEKVRENNPVDIGGIVNPLEKQDYLGIVVAKENTELANALVAALQAIKQDGTYDAIFKKWKLEHAALKEFGINMTTTKPLK